MDNEKPPLHRGGFFILLARIHLYANRLIPKLPLV